MTPIPNSMEMLLHQFAAIYRLEKFYFLKSAKCKKPKKNNDFGNNWFFSLFNFKSININLNCPYIFYIRLNPWSQSKGFLLQMQWSSTGLAISWFGNLKMANISTFEANSLISKCRSGKANEVMCALNTFFALKLTGPEVVLNLSKLEFQSAN